MMTPAAAAGAPIGFSTLTSFVFSLGGARRADFGRTRPLGSSAAGGSCGETSSARCTWAGVAGARMGGCRQRGDEKGHVDMW
eukprot:700186-Prymnesium_polylepis.1